jgi:hypothetical protein
MKAAGRRFIPGSSRRVLVRPPPRSRTSEEPTLNSLLTELADEGTDR